MPPREQAQVVQGYGDRLLQRLRALGINQSELATRAKVSRQTLHRAIHRDELTARVAKKIATMVGQDLLGPSDGAPAAVVREPAAPYAPAPREQAGPGAGALTWFGELLEVLREDEGLTQDDAAEGMGISVTTYRRILAGATKPRRHWIERFGENLDMRNPESLYGLRETTWPADPIFRALGRQLRAWRATSGYDLLDVADAIGEDLWVPAAFEVGDEDVLSSLALLAPLYGTTEDVLYQAARLALPAATRKDDDDPRVVARILTFEAAQREAQSKQRVRARGRGDEPGVLIANTEWLYTSRAKAGFSVKDAAKRLGRTPKEVQAWEDGLGDPTLLDVEAMATLYRTTPWYIIYGGPHERAWEFPNARESRSLIFSTLLAPADHAWLYRFLAELAAMGLGEVELTSIRETLTSPDTYSELAYHVPRERWADFVGARLRVRATEIWRDLRDPEWRGRAAGEPPSLPAIFAATPEAEAAAAALLEEVERRRGRWSPAEVEQIVNALPKGLIAARAEPPVATDAAPAAPTALLGRESGPEDSSP